MNSVNQKPRVTLLTQNTYWLKGSGVWARTREVVRFLAAHTQLRVMFLAPIKDPEDARIITALDIPCEFFAPGVEGQVTYEQIHAWIPRTLRSKPVDVCWVDKTELSWLLPILPRHARTIVDTHDLMSKRYQSFARLGASNIKGVDPVSEEEERATLARYDRVLCIQAEDRDIVRDWLGPDHALLGPHPTELHRQILRNDVASITFVASGWIANVNGLLWFLNEIWPQVARPGLTLDIYGDICRALHELQTDLNRPGLRLHGQVPRLDAVYRDADIIINPVRAGAGLKIKSVEALANGLPLVTTGEGARGLQFLDRRALLIADTTADFVATLNRLIADPALRQALAAGAWDWATGHCTPDSCFGEVLAWINEGARRP